MQKPVVRSKFYINYSLPIVCAFFFFSRLVPSQSVNIFILGIIIVMCMGGNGVLIELFKKELFI
jgi:hypothetical protein